MATLVQFSDIKGKEVWINADRVCSISEFTRDSSIVGFGAAEGEVRIKRPAAQVANAVSNAGRRAAAHAVANG